MASEVVDDVDNVPVSAAQDGSGDSTPGDPPQAVQIVDVSEDGEHFTLNEAALTDILSKVPADMKVSVLAVVGAFRTGKSFVLDIFLRYLQYCEAHPEYEFGNGDEEAGNSAWMFADQSIGGAASKDNETGFKWRSGHERMTTGMWMWNKHFVVKRPGSDEQIAVLVIDTQGLYDLQTSDQLTTSIFGLSTLISSYLVFNVSLQIQEDNMKSLALFAEYARVALRAEHGPAVVDEDDEGTASPNAPFQVVEFLVRDSRLRAKSMEDKKAEMEEQVQRVMTADANEDIRIIRKQVRACFQDVRGFFLPYPGEMVSESDTYTGDVSEIRPLFREMVEEYVRSLFKERLTVKRVQGREVTAGELRHFFVAYAQSFSDADIFPEAQSLLIATAIANNRAHVDKAMRLYTTEMDKVVGAGCAYISNKKLQDAHKAAMGASLTVFDEGTAFGPDELREQHRQNLKQAIGDAHARNTELNKSRDPFKNSEMYIFALGIGLFAYILRIVADTTCGGISETCDAASTLFSNIYVAFFFFILLSIAVSWGNAVKRVHTIMQVFGIPGLAKEKQD